MQELKEMILTRVKKRIRATESYEEKIVSEQEYRNNKNLGSETIELLKILVDLQYLEIGLEKRKDKIRQEMAAFRWSVSTSLFGGRQG